MTAMMKSKRKDIKNLKTTVFINRDKTASKYSVRNIFKL